MLCWNITWNNAFSHCKPPTTILDLNKYGVRCKHLMNFENQGNKLTISVEICYVPKKAWRRWYAEILLKNNECSNHCKPPTTILDSNKYDNVRCEHLMSFETRGTKVLISVEICCASKNALLQWHAYILPKSKHIPNHCEPPYWMYGFRYHKKSILIEQVDSISEE